MGHKTGDGLSIRVTNDSGGDLAHGDPAGISGVFGFCDTDVVDTAEVSLSIGQEEREVQLPAKVGGWLLGDNVYFDGTVFDDVAAGAPWDVAVGTVARVTDAAGGYSWMVVHPGAFAGRA
jgi:hypothetical protein